jgi:hypothetical protein
LARETIRRLEEGKLQQMRLHRFADDEEGQAGFPPLIDDRPEYQLSATGIFNEVFPVSPFMNIKPASAWMTGIVAYTRVITAIAVMEPYIKE